MTKPIVSIVIPTKNAHATLEATLRSIAHQSYPSKLIETIVVDNYSFDQTITIARKFTSSVYKKGPERSVQRNFGMISKSHGNYVLYLDQDMVLGKDCVKECIERLENERKLVGLYIPESIVGDWLLNRVRNFERSFYNGTVIDCVRFIRKKEFVDIGGFDSTLDGIEDWDLDKRIRQCGQTAIISQPLFHYAGEVTLRSYLSKKSYYARSFKRYIAKWGKSDPDVVKQFSLWYRLFGVFLEKGKWKKVVSQPQLFFSLLVLRILTGLNVRAMMFFHDKTIRVGQYRRL